MAINFPSSPSNGQEFTSGATTWVYDGTKWGLKSTAATTNDSLPIGAIMWFGNTTTTPPGYIAADGTAVSRTTYAALFAVIGTTHGSGDGSTTFNVPNVAATTGKYYIRYTTSLGTVTTTSLSTAPVGTMLDWPTTSSYPTGYLRADGTAVSRTSYADLFALIGTTYGVGDNSTTFNLPNLVSAGSGSPVKIIKASLGGIVEPSTVAHAASHTEGGSDVVSVTLNQIPNYRSFRNLVINGNMAISQRNGTSTVTPANTAYTLDRWKMGLTQSSKVTVAQSTVAPARFTNSLLVTSTSAYTIASGDEFEIIQPIEGNVLSSLAWGTASALNASLSFWVRSSLTGIFGGCIYDNATNYTYTFSYNISAANTWEYKTISISGPTSGTWPTDNSAGGLLLFNFGAGSSRTITAGSWNTGFKPAPTGQTNLTGTNGATWYITGVQLEAGSVATPFEFEPFETTLRKCQRYYYKTGGTAYGPIAMAATHSTTGGRVYLPLPVPMRIPPTGANITGSGLQVGTGTFTSMGFDRATANAVMFGLSGTGYTAGGANIIFCNPDATSYVDVTGAEL